VNSITVNPVFAFDFIVDKVKVNIFLNFPKDMIFTNAPVKI
jgi:hypothetical protein